MLVDAEFVAQDNGVDLWDRHLKQQIYLGNDDFIKRMQQHAGLDMQNPNDPSKPRKANLSKIQSSAPALDRDIDRFASIKHTTKAERNQSVADAFFQGGHTQTAIALAFDLSSSTVSRIIKEYENSSESRNL